jgi:hypothetical protein
MEDIDYQCSGLLSSTMSRIFTDFMKNKDNEIRPKDIFNSYIKTERKKILSLIKESNNVKVGQIMQSFLSYLSTSKPTFSKEEKENQLKNISAFLLDIPSDIGATYFTIIKEIKDRDPEAFKYLTLLQADLMKDEKYKKQFYEAFVDMSKRSRNEK